MRPKLRMFSFLLHTETKGSCRNINAMHMFLVMKDNLLEYSTVMEGSGRTCSRRLPDTSSQTVRGQRGPRTISFSSWKVDKEEAQTENRAVQSVNREKMSLERSKTTIGVSDKNYMRNVTAKQLQTDEKRLNKNTTTDEKIAHGIIHLQRDSIQPHRHETH